jgi:hypothetical protein
MASLRSHSPHLDGLFTLYTEVNGLFVFTRVGATIGNKKKPPIIKITFSGNFATPNLPKKISQKFFN